MTHKTRGEKRRVDDAPTKAIIVEEKGCTPSTKRLKTDDTRSSPSSTTTVSTTVEPELNFDGWWSIGGVESFLDELKLEADTFQLRSGKSAKTNLRPMFIEWIMTVGDEKIMSREMCQQAIRIFDRFNTQTEDVPVNYQTKMNALASVWFAMRASESFSTHHPYKGDKAELKELLRFMPSTEKKGVDVATHDLLKQIADMSLSMQFNFFDPSPSVHQWTQMILSQFINQLGFLVCSATPATSPTTVDTPTASPLLSSPQKPSVVMGSFKPHEIAIIVRAITNRRFFSIVTYLSDLMLIDTLSTAYYPSEIAVVAIMSAIFSSESETGIPSSLQRHVFDLLAQSWQSWRSVAAATDTTDPIIRLLPLTKAVRHYRDNILPSVPFVVSVTARDVVPQFEANVGQSIQLWQHAKDYTLAKAIASSIS